MTLRIEAEGNINKPYGEPSLRVADLSLSMFGFWTGRAPAKAVKLPPSWLEREKRTQRLKRFGERCNKLTALVLQHSLD